MIKKFTKKHPWLTGKIKPHFWNILERLRIESFLYNFDENDTKMILDLKDHSVARFIFFGNYEKDTVSFVTKYINCGDTVVDVGANIGFFTMIFSDLVGEDGKVHSFEPSQREFLHLCKNIGANKSRNILLNQLALSNSNGYSKMNILSKSKFGAYNSLRRISHSKVQNEIVQIENVRTLRFDDYLTLFPEAIPSLIKIDVEGAEQQVLEGMATLLRTDYSPCLIIEICEGTHRDNQGSAQELITYIESFGYHLYGLNSVGDLIPFRIGRSLNGVALKQSHLMNASNRGVNVVA
jgi:FkbM family methyltransferase